MKQTRTVSWGNVSWLNQHVWSWRIRRYLAISCIVAVLLIILHVLGSYFGQLLPVEYSTTRLLLSATAQSLAALLAITLSLAFVFLQVISGRYSLGLTRMFFDNRLEAFLIVFSLATIGTSLFHLATGARWLYSPGTVALPVLFQAVFVLVLFIIVFDRGIRRISHDPLVTHLENRTRLYMCLYLYSLRETTARARAAEQDMRATGVIPTAFFEADITIVPKKDGVVEYIRIARLTKLIHQLRARLEEGEGTLEINKNIGSPIGPRAPIRVKWRVQSEEEKQFLERELVKIFKIAKPVPWENEIKWGLDSLVAMAKKGIQDSETPLVERASTAISRLLQHYIEGRKELGIAMPAEAVDNSFRMGAPQSLEYGVELVGDLIAFASRSGEIDSMLSNVHGLSEVGDYAILQADYGATKEVNHGFSRAYLAARQHNDDLLFQRVRYYLDRNFTTALRQLEEGDKPTINALRYSMQDIAKTISELIRWDLDSTNIKQFKGSLHVLQELLVNSMFGHEQRDQIQIVDSISSWIQGSTLLLVAYIIHRIYRKEVEPIEARVFLDGLDSALGSLVDAYRPSLKVERRLSWFIEDTKRVVSGIPYREQRNAYVLLTLYRLFKGGNLDHIKKEQDSLDFAKFVDEVLKHVEKETPLWDSLFNGNTKDLIVKLRTKYEEIVSEITQEVRQLPLSEDILNAVKKAIMKGTEVASLGRGIALLRHHSEEPPSELIPLKMNVTVPRLDLVNSPYHDPASNFPNILEYEGRELRALETLNVISKIADVLDAGSTKGQDAVRLKLNARAVRKVKKLLLSEGYKPSLVLIGDSLAPWEAEGFQRADSQAEERTPGFIGSIEGLPVYWHRLIAKDKAIVLDGQAMVQIDVFEDLSEDRITITDHYAQDTGETNSADEHSEEEKVLITASELVSITLLNAKAGRVV